jgi:hypothetical protein
MGLHKAIVVKEFAAYGFNMRGLFATSVIKKGESVWWHSAEDDHPEVTLHLTRAQLEAHPRSDILKTYSYMKGEIHDVVKKTIRERRKTFFSLSFFHSPSVCAQREKENQIFLLIESN